MNIASAGFSRLPSAVAVGLVGALALGGSGCKEQPKVSQMGQPVEAKGVKLSVDGYAIERPELTSEGRIHEYDKPVLAVKVTMTNTGDKPFAYKPTHGLGRRVEATTPLLYYAPPEDKPLPPKKKQVISGVVLEEGSFPAQVQQRTTLEPGQTISDLFLFQVPAEKQADLIFSLPPTMHRGGLPVLFRIPYQYKKPKGPKTYKVGDSVELDGAALTVKSAETTYVKIKHKSEGEGFSSDPLFKVSYTVENTGSEPLTYRPGHRALSGRRVAQLRGGEETYARMKFSPSTEVVGQVAEETTVEPGDSVEDFGIFERPDEGVESLTFEFPATRVDAKGLVRVEIPYEYTEPELPEELQTDEEDEAEE